MLFRSLEDVAPPAAPPGGVVVDVAAASLNFPDLLAIAGQYQVKAPLPFTPGLEAAGVIAAVGPGSRHAVGDRVVVHAPWGAFAEQMVVGDGAVLPWPAPLTAAEAASLVVTYQTGHVALARRARLATGETLAVLGAAGGTGLAAIQLGKALGARVIAVAGGAAKVAACTAAGADVAIDHQAGDFAAAILAATDGRGADVIYDPVGGDATDRALKALALEGRLLVIGFAAGAIPAIKLNRLLLRNVDVIGVYWGAYFDRDRTVIDHAHAALIELCGRGAIRPVVSRTLPLDQLADGLDAIAARQAIGNLALVMSPEAGR